MCRVEAVVKFLLNTSNALQGSLKLSVFLTEGQFICAHANAALGLCDTKFLQCFE